MLEQVEIIIKEKIDINVLVERLKNSFYNLILNKENDEIKDELEARIGDGNSYELVLSGISVHWDMNRNGLYYRARLDIYDKKKGMVLAWYSQEYGSDDEVLDDFFDFMF